VNPLRAIAYFSPSKSEVGHFCRMFIFTRDSRQEVNPALCYNCSLRILSNNTKLAAP
jgi:hypothetical protein